MSDTFAGLQNRTRRYLHEEDEDTSFWEPNFLKQLINQSYRRRASQLIMAFEGWFVSVARRNLTAEQAQYAFPDGFIRMHKLELVRTDGATVPLERNERHRATNPTSSAGGDQYLPTYRMLGNGFVLEPAPIETVSDGIQLEYCGVPVELSADGDQLHISFPEIFEELVVLDAAVSAFDAEGAQEAGVMRSLLRLRAEWELDWERFIDQRTISRQQIEPFVPAYEDA